MKKALAITITLTAIGVAVKVLKNKETPKRIDSGTINTKNFRMINSSHRNLS